MSILIAYGGKYGTSRKCAEILADLLPDASVVDLKKTKQPDISAFDAIIIGGSIHYGLLNRSVKNFVIRNVQLLREKITAYYVCCGFADSAEQYFSTNFPKLALEYACAKECFGGELITDLMSKFDRFVLKAVTSNTEIKKEKKTPLIDMDALNRLADEIKSKLNI